MDIQELIFNKINNATSIGIVCHINPDGDAMGSALALWRVLSLYGKKCDCLCDDKVPNKYKNIPLVEYFNKKTLSKYELIISVDISDPSRCGCYLPLFQTAGVDTISIDHHAGRTAFTKLNYVILSSSTAEIIFKLLTRYFEKYISLEVAELLYIGLITDCGGFAHEYVTYHSFQAAANLMRYGVNNSELYRKYLTEKPLGQIKMSAHVISNAIYECGGHLVFLVFNQNVLNKFNCDLSQTSDCLADIMRAENIWVGISLSEVTNNSYKVSIRTKGDLVNATEIAGEFGGGGHKNASGCRINGELGVVLDKLTFAVSKHI